MQVFKFSDLYVESNKCFFEYYLDCCKGESTRAMQSTYFNLVQKIPMRVNGII